jgi:hypothetical protein
MDSNYAVVGFRHTTIDSVSGSVERATSLVRSVVRRPLRYKIKEITLSKSLVRRANILTFSTESMTRTQ